MTAPNVAAAMQHVEKLKETVTVQRLRSQVGSIGLRVYLHNAHGAIPRLGLDPQELR